MNRKVVLIVDEDISRAEKLDFILRLGGYITRFFSCEKAALNWARYGCSDGEALCFLFNSRIEMDRAEEILSMWTADGMSLPVVLVQRGKGSWNHLLSLDTMEQFVVCEPESVMQTLEILTEIAAQGWFDVDPCVDHGHVELGDARCK